MIKFLLVSANAPVGTLTELKFLKDEQSKIQDNLRALSHIGVTPINDVSHEYIWRELLSAEVQKYQIFHFSGHSSCDHFQLNRDSDPRTPENVAFPEFAKTLAGPRTLRLVFLNSCNSWNAGKYLVEELGIPNVIVTTAKVEDHIAMAFASSFYQHWGMRGVALGTAFELAVKELNLRKHYALLQGSDDAAYFDLNP